MFVNLLIVIVIALIAMGLIYRLMPFKKLSNDKPAAVFFPKYVWDVSDFEKLEQNLMVAGFKKKRTKLYRRGNILGDFSSKLILLHISINTNKNQAKLYGASPFGIAFDTGDLWEIARKLT